MFKRVSAEDLIAIVLSSDKKKGIIEFNPGESLIGILYTIFHNTLKNNGFNLTRSLITDIDSSYSRILGDAADSLKEDKYLITDMQNGTYIITKSLRERAKISRLKIPISEKIP